ncbi:MAG: hypothetical protein JXA82_01260 [Sedimentisphaerales bacterium]|nr:hypothetical protein [Sedimentisphaerales bacterium]
MNRILSLLLGVLFGIGITIIAFYSINIFKLKSYQSNILSADVSIVRTSARILLQKESTAESVLSVLMMPSVSLETKKVIMEEMQESYFYIAFFMAMIDAIHDQSSALEQESLDVYDDFLHKNFIRGLGVIALQLPNETDPEIQEIKLDFLCKYLLMDKKSLLELANQEGWEAVREVAQNNLRLIMEYNVSEEEQDIEEQPIGEKHNIMSSITHTVSMKY